MYDPHHAVYLLLFLCPLRSAYFQRTDSLAAFVVVFGIHGAANYAHTVSGIAIVSQRDTGVRDECDMSSVYNTSAGEREQW